jgi:hypothetical protein
MRRECTSNTTEGLDVPLRAVVGRAHRNENSRSERAQRRLSDVYMLEHRRLRRRGRWNEYPRIGLHAMITLYSTRT